MHGRDYTISGIYRYFVILIEEKIEGALAAHPESKIALWAHNYHVGYTEGKSMGSHLKSKLGDQYINFGLFGNQGSLSVRVGNIELGKFEDPPTQVSLRPAGEDTYEHLFSKTGIQIGFVDLRTSRKERIWENNNYGVREVGWAYDPDHDEYFTQKKDISSTYDTAIFIDKVSPTEMFRSW